MELMTKDEVCHLSPDGHLTESGKEIWNRLSVEKKKTFTGGWPSSAILTGGRFSCNGKGESEPMPLWKDRKRRRSEVPWPCKKKIGFFRVTGNTGWR